MDLDRSPVIEMKEMINSNGKLFLAPTNLLPVTPESSRIDPNYTLKDLYGEHQNLLYSMKKYPASLMTITGSGFAAPMVESFRSPLLDTVRKHNLGLFDLEPIPSRLKYILWSYCIKRSARKTVDETQYSKYFVFRGGKELRTMLNVPNLFGGYLYLFDKEGVVRWRACGMASKGEIQTLKQCIVDLTKPNH